MPVTQGTMVEVCESCGRWRVSNPHSRNLPWLAHNHLLKAFRKFKPLYVRCPDCERQERVVQAAGSVH